MEVASPSTRGVCACTWTLSSIDGGNVARSSFAASATVGPISSGRRSDGWRRLKTRIRSTSSLPRRAAFISSARSSSSDSRERVSLPISSAYPVMANRMLLKSCAIPPARVPTASSFCACRSSSSRWRRSSSAFLRALMSTIEARTNIPSSVATGVRPISIGTSVRSLPQPVQVASRPHRAHPRVRHEPAAEARVPGAKSNGDHHLDRPPEQLLTRVAEQPLHLAVHQHDVALGVRHQQAAGRRFDGGAKPQLDGAGGVGGHADKSAASIPTWQVGNHLTAPRPRGVRAATRGPGGGTGDRFA